MNFKGKIEEKSGITIIGLIVTIIILLVLAGVTLNLALGEGNIIGRAISAKNITEKSKEKEALEIVLALSQMKDNVSTSNKYYIGIPLKDKIIDGRNNSWDIVIINDTQKNYGTGWNYIAKGTDINDYGKAKYEWLANYDTGELIFLETDNYTKLSSGDSLAITDGLIFNVDSSMIEGSDQEELEKQLGDNIELVNFDWNQNSGLTSTAFNFDGVDDYIKIQYDDATEKQKLAENGFTFEFYGILDGGTSYGASGQVLIAQRYKGIFCYWNGDENKQATMRFGSNGNGTVIQWNAASTCWDFSDYSVQTSPWNIQYIFEDNLYKKELYFTITLDTQNSYVKDGKTYYKQTLYLNGEKTQFDGGYNKKQWDDFIEQMNNLRYFCIGRSSMTEDGRWNYSKMNCYALRLYNRGLSESEVKENYDKSVAYRSTMSNN